MSIRTVKKTKNMVEVSYCMYPRVVQSPDFQKLNHSGDPGFFTETERELCQATSCIKVVGEE